jgi:hypothetical protein
MNQNNLNMVTIGSDPEAFVINKNTGEVVSAIGLIPGNKDTPFAISEFGHAVQTDNVMVEFCVPPATDSASFVKDINFCLDTLNSMLPEDIEVSIIASASLDKKYLRTKQARLFGCDPDFNVYTMQPNQAPTAVRNNNRCAGGHIHIGYNNPDFTTNMKIIQAMDLFLGIPSLVLDKDIERRKMYGKAGCFREKKYGCEYRTLSNFWIRSEESIVWAYNQSIKAVEFAMNEDWLSDDTILEIQLAINTFDLNLACKIAKKYDILMSYKQEELV